MVPLWIRLQSSPSMRWNRSSGAFSWSGHRLPILESLAGIAMPPLPPPRRATHWKLGSSGTRTPQRWQHWHWGRPDSKAADDRISCCILAIGKRAAAIAPPGNATRRRQRERSSSRRRIEEKVVLTYRIRGTSLPSTPEHDGACRQAGLCNLCQPRTNEELSHQEKRLRIVIVKGRASAPYDDGRVLGVGALGECWDEFSAARRAE